MLTTQLRTLSNVRVLGTLSLICVFGVIALSLQIVFAAENEVREDAYLIGNPDQATTRGWVTFALGVSTCAWAYVPSFLTVELSNAAVMQDPASFPRAIWLSCTLNIFVFILCGVSCVLQWGWDVNDPVTFGTVSNPLLYPADSSRSRVLNALLFLSCLISYALDSVPLARSCRDHFQPSLSLSDWSFRGCTAYLLVTLPTFAFAVLAALFVPSLFCMLAIVTALTVPWANYVFPALLHLADEAESNSNDGEDDQLRPEKKSLLLDATATSSSSCSPSSSSSSYALSFPPAPSRALAHVVLLTGVVVFILCAFAAVGKLAIEELRGPVVVGCHGWLVIDEQR